LSSFCAILKAPDNNSDLDASPCNGEGTDVLCSRLIRDEQGLKALFLNDNLDAGLELCLNDHYQRQRICGGLGRST